MYGHTGAEMRAAFAELLRLHRVQQRLGGTREQRAAAGLQIRQCRLTVLLWCGQALRSVGPLTFSNQAPAQPNPFRSVGVDGTSPAGELARAVDLAAAETTGPAAGIDQITTPTGQPILELWRAAARAAALAEHDTSPEVTSAMTAGQAQAVVADVAAITQALVVLDQRYRNTPGWEPLPQPARLGWAALATALDVDLGLPDYTVDTLGWRPKTKLIDGPAKQGILGVLQAEHNLLVRMKTFPSATNLRYVLDSQRLLSRHLVPLAARIDQRLAERWDTRADTHAQLVRQFRSVGGTLGKGGFAAAEGANAVSRLRALPTDTIVEPRVLGGFQQLFDRLDERVADVIDAGIDRGWYLQRARLPQLDPNGGHMVTPARERFMPFNGFTGRELLEIVRDKLRPRPNLQLPTPGPSRADLHTALIHRPTAAPRSVEAPGV